MDWQIDTRNWGRSITHIHWRLGAGKGNRIYYIHSGCLDFEAGEEKMQLRPGYIYILPENIKLCAENEDAHPLDHTFFDFDIIPTFLFRRVVCLEVAKYPLLRKALELLEEFTNVYYEHHLYDKDVLSAVNLYLQNLLWIISQITKLPVMNDPRIMDTLHFIQDNLSQPLSVQVLASRLFLNEQYFIRLFTQNTGQTPHQYIQNRRMSLAKALLLQNRNLTEIAEMCGYDNYSTFSKAFKKHYSCSPSDYAQIMTHTYP